MQDNAFDANGNMTLDFGFFDPVSVGDTAFVDLDGSGNFLDTDGNTLTAPFAYGTAVTYVPSAADARRGEVTLILTTDDPAGPCEPVSNSVTITVLKVDCGQFMWDGSND